MDVINGIFEMCGALFIAPSIFKLHREKEVKGVSWVHASFFTAWGYWNLFYYPSLGQWLSFSGGVALVLTNTLWLAQLIYYSNRKAVPHVGS
jgi:hypothetical protein